MTGSLLLRIWCWCCYLLAAAPCLLASAGGGIFFAMIQQARGEFSCAGWVVEYLREQPLQTWTGRPMSERHT